MKGVLLLTVLGVLGIGAPGAGSAAEAPAVIGCAVVNGPGWGEWAAPASPSPTCGARRGPGG
jgi:hypothetical protein